MSIITHLVSYVNTYFETIKTNFVTFKIVWFRIIPSMYSHQYSSPRTLLFAIYLCSHHFWKSLSREFLPIIYSVYFFYFSWSHYVLGSSIQSLHSRMLWICANFLSIICSTSVISFLTPTYTYPINHASTQSHYHSQLSQYWYHAIKPCSSFHTGWNIHRHIVYELSSFNCVLTRSILFQLQVSNRCWLGFRLNSNQF